MQVAGLRVHIQEAGHDLARGLAFGQIGQGRDAVGGIVMLGQLVEGQDRTVVLGHRDGRAGLVVDLDGLAVSNHVEPVHGLVVLADIVVALG